MARLTTLPNEPRPVKILYMGASGTGKTGSLISLAEADYDLRIIDLDKGLAALTGFIQHQCPDRLSQLDVEQVQDELRGTAAGMEIRKARGFTDTLRLCTKWTDESNPAEWGTNSILIIDSLTRLGDYAFNYEKKTNPAVKEPRQWYNFAQQKIKQFLDMVTSAEFNTNVIIITHIEIRDTIEGQKQFPTSIGKAIGPIIPSFFNTAVLATKRGSGQNVKRVISTVPTAMLDLKNPKPFSIGFSQKIWLKL